MTYDTTEASVSSGKPIELYDFENNSNHYRYTSGPVLVAYGGYTYVPETIQRGELEMSENAFRNELEIKINRDNVFIRRFIQAPLEGMVNLIVYRGHGINFVTFWVGVVSQVKFNSEEVTITATPRTSSLLRTGLRRKYQKLCNYPLYAVGCGVNLDSFKVVGTIDTISGFTITSSAFATKANDWFKAGKIVVGDAERLITTHTGNTITANRGIVEAVVGNSFTAYAGCSHTMNICTDKFNNLINYGGQPWIPTKNPFSGDPII